VSIDSLDEDQDRRPDARGSHGRERVAPQSGTTRPLSLSSSSGGASRRPAGSMRVTSPTAHNFLWNVAPGELRGTSIM